MNKIKYRRQSCSLIRLSLRSSAVLFCNFVNFLNQFRQKLRVLAAAILSDDYRGAAIRRILKFIPDFRQDFPYLFKKFSHYQCVVVAVAGCI